MKTDGSVWVVSELFHPERTSTGHFLSCIATGLASSFPVRVLCAQPTYSARGRRARRRERLAEPRSCVAGPRRFQRTSFSCVS
jgi:hypothetical protein